MTGEQSTRRRFLASSLALAVSCVAGCLNQGTAGGGLGSPSVISETSISGRNLVVTLADDHEVSKLNLIGPDGSAFKSTAVQTGATQVKLELFDYRRGWHYNPGTHTLLALDEDETELAETEIDLSPELEITEVKPYSGGRPTPSNRANLLVTVENIGTGPTWVYDLGYKNSLNRDANRLLTNDYAKTVPLMNLDLPDEKSGIILDPGESTELLGTRPPLLLSEDDHCNDLRVEFEVIVLCGAGKNARQDLVATLSGDPLKANFRETCTEISVKKSSEG